MANRFPLKLYSGQEISKEEFETYLDTFVDAEYVLDMMKPTPLPSELARAFFNRMNWHQVLEDLEDHVLNEEMGYE